MREYKLRDWHGIFLKEMVALSLIGLPFPQTLMRLDMIVTSLVDVYAAVPESTRTGKGVVGRVAEFNPFVSQ